MPKLLILSARADEYARLIESARLPNLAIVTEPADCDIVFGEPDLIREALPQLTRLKWAQSTWAGVEPLLNTSRRDYILTNARGVFGGLMSEFVFGYLLLHERKILQRLENQKLGEWDASPTGILRGRTIGLLGVGSIGAEIARTAKFFGMKVLGYTRETETSKDVDGYFHPAAPGSGNPPAQEQAPAIQKFAERLDYLVSVLPNTGDTRRIVNADLLNSLPRHAIFINAGRGSAVDESALIEALNRNTIAGAVLDVFEQEPLPQDHPFWRTPNLLITFHTSAPSLPEDITKIFIGNYPLFNSGRPLKYQVGFERGY